MMMEISSLHLLIDYHLRGEVTDNKFMLDVPWHARWYHAEGSHSGVEIYFF